MRRKIIKALPGKDDHPCMNVSRVCTSTPTSTLPRTMPYSNSSNDWQEFLYSSGGGSTRAHCDSPGGGNGRGGDSRGGFVSEAFRYEELEQERESNSLQRTRGSKSAIKARKPTLGSISASVAHSGRRQFRAVLIPVHLMKPLCEQLKSINEPVGKQLSLSERGCAYVTCHGDENSVWIRMILDVIFLSPFNANTALTDTRFGRLQGWSWLRLWSLYRSYCKGTTNANPRKVWIDLHHLPGTDALDIPGILRFRQYDHEACDFCSILKMHRLSRKTTGAWPPTTQELKGLQPMVSFISNLANRYVSFLFLTLYCAVPPALSRKHAERPG